MSNDPPIIMSRHSGEVTRNGVTVELVICRLERTMWSMELVDEEQNSIVWEQEFTTDDEAYAAFLSEVDAYGLDAIVQDPSRMN